MVKDASVKLALVIVLRSNLAVSKLEALVEAIDSVERAENGLEVNVDCAVFALFIEPNVFHRAELVAKSLAHVLPYATIIALSIRIPVYPINTTPSDNHARLFSKLARLILVRAHTATDIPDLLRFDLAAFIVKRTCAGMRFALLNFQVCDDTIAVLAKALTLLIAHLRHHGFCFAYLGTLGGALLVGVFVVDVVHLYVIWLVMDWGRRNGRIGIAYWRC